jgi:hypothetical protein
MNTKIIVYGLLLLPHDIQFNLIKDMYEFLKSAYIQKGFFVHIP